MGLNPNSNAAKSDDAAGAVPAKAPVYELPYGHVSDKIAVTLANSVYMRQTELTPSLRGKLIRLAAFANPVYASMQCLRLNIYNTPRVIDRSVNGDDWLVQYAGRLHRQCDGKREVRIYDYLDQRVAMCSKMFNRRAARHSVRTESIHGSRPFVRLEEDCGRDRRSIPLRGRRALPHTTK